MATRGSRTRLSREARRAINRIARAEGVHAKTIERAFLDVVAEYADSIDEEAALAYLASGVLPNATNEFRGLIANTLDSLWREMIEAGNELADPAGALRGIAAQNLRDRHAENWITNRGSELVTNFTAQQRRSINALVDYQRHIGGSIEDLADGMRGVAGLTERQSIALARMRADLQAQGMTPKQVLIATERKRRQMELQRARTIARTELSAATNEGIVAASMAVDAEAEDGLTPRMFIVAYPDCCSDCREIENRQPENGIPLGDDWPEGRPPFHPNCRCVVDVRRVKT